MVILGRHNARIKQIRCLASRKHRERSGHFFIEGARLVAEAVQTGAQIETLVVAPDLLVSPFACRLLKEPVLRDVPLLEVSAAAFDTLAARNTAHGIGALVRQRWERLDEVHLKEGRCWVAVDAVQNPGNLGTILRTSAAVEGAGIILIGDTTDPYDPAAVRASLGTLFSQRLVRTTFARFSTWKQEGGYPVVGTSPCGSTDYKAVAYQSPLVLLMGSERQGLSIEQQALCDLIVQIPMAGRCDSLNLGVATSILLYEIFNQQRSAPAAGALRLAGPG